MLSAFSKAGSVGYRSDRYYDQKNLWGQEIRYLSPHLDPVLIANALNSIQDKMTDKEYFLSEEKVQDYFNVFPNIGIHQHQGAFLNRLMYNGDIRFKLKTKSFSNEDIVKFLTEFNENEFVAMLIHDWKVDPLFYNNPARLKQIAEAQEYCLKLLFKGMPSIDVMELFIRKSGVAYEIHRLVLGE